MYNKYKKLKMVSPRTRKIVKIRVLATIDDLIGVQHYKSLPGTQYRRILDISNSIIIPKQEFFGSIIKYFIYVPCGTVQT